MYKKIAATTLVIVALIGVAVYFNWSNENEVPRTTSVNQPVASLDEPRTLDECTELAEREYRVYMIMNNDGFQDVNGTTIYSMSREKMDTQNAIRATAVDSCYRKFD